MFPLFKLFAECAVFVPIHRHCKRGWAALVYIHTVMWLRAAWWCCYELLTQWQLYTERWVFGSSTAGNVMHRRGLVLCLTVELWAVSQSCVDNIREYAVICSNCLSYLHVDLISWMSIIQEFSMPFIPLKLRVTAFSRCLRLQRQSLFTTWFYLAQKSDIRLASCLKHAGLHSHGNPEELSSF